MDKKKREALKDLNFLKKFINNSRILEKENFKTQSR